MPILLRHNQMTPAQQSHHVTMTFRRYALSRSDVPVADLDWRMCMWFRQDGSRPVFNRAGIILNKGSPLEILYVLSRDLAAYQDGISLLDRARQALLTDLLDAKAPLLVFCDWLEEHQFPDAGFLREFCALTLCWTEHCLRPGRR